MTATIQRADTEDFAEQWREWHTQDEARIGGKHGFLAVTSINWLDERPQRFADAPGEWSTDAIGVHITLADELGGRPLALTVFASEHAPGYLALFTDETSGVTTWPANRSLFLGVPADDGTVTVDFNRATNLPCAYTDLATCPLPPAENRLPVAVRAGEKIPHERA
jgi:uncharacterized protein (DUF1684 family)